MAPLSHSGTQVVPTAWDTKATRNESSMHDMSQFSLWIVVSSSPIVSVANGKHSSRSRSARYYVLSLSGICGLPSAPLSSGKPDTAIRDRRPAMLRLNSEILLDTNSVTRNVEAHEKPLLTSMHNGRATRGNDIHFTGPKRHFHILFSVALLDCGDCSSLRGLGLLLG